MTIVIECTLKAIFALFDSASISSGMSREVPGGATIQLGQMPMEKRDLPSIQATLIPILVEVGKDVAVGVFAAWLYDKLKGEGEGEGRKFLRVNRVMVEVTPEAITKVLTESIEIEERTMNPLQPACRNFGLDDLLCEPCRRSRILPRARNLRREKPQIGRNCFVQANCEPNLAHHALTLPECQQQPTV